MSGDEVAPVARAGFPASPCTQVCTLDDRNICLGCRRTLDEIIAWSRMTPAEQRAVIERLSSRR